MLVLLGSSVGVCDYVDDIADNVDVANAIDSNDNVDGVNVDNDVVVCGAFNDYLIEHVLLLSARPQLSCDFSLSTACPSVENLLFCLNSALPLFEICSSSVCLSVCFSQSPLQLSHSTLFCSLLLNSLCSWYLG